MSTPSSNGPDAGRPAAIRPAGDAGSNDSSSIGHRKKRHVEICVDPDTYRVEGDVSAGFDGLSFVHSALPELAEPQIDTTATFLGSALTLPIFISCMTGGSLEGFSANRSLARAAQQAGVPVGLGSVRVIFEHEEVFEHFHIKPLALDVPVLANLGAVQVRDIPHLAIGEMLRRLEVQALVVHLNPGQELFQPDGDRDFRDLLPAIGRLCQSSPVPIIVKETGFGVRPTLAARLTDLGVALIDVAGSGGTNWVAVESYRLPAEEASIARELDDWGLPTAILLDAMRGMNVALLASGGLRDGLDVAKALALGAELAGLALPFIRAVTSGGVDEVLALVGRIERVLRAVMLLTGSRDLEALRNAPLMRTPSFRAAVAELRRAEGLSTDDDR